MAYVCITDPLLWCVFSSVLPCARVWTSLENGRVTVHPPGPVVEGTILHYSCLEGFILVGRNSTQCTKLGKWDSPKPVCHCECSCICFLSNSGQFDMLLIPNKSVILFLPCSASNVDDRHYTGKNVFVFLCMIKPVL